MTNPPLPPHSQQPLPPQQAPASREPHKLSLTAKLLLFVALPLVLIIVVIVALVIVFSSFQGTSVSEKADVIAGSSVDVTVPNATVTFSPSSDDQVHVSMTGTYSGPTPTLTATTSGRETQITGGCANGWFFSRCDVTLAIAIPAGVDLDFEGTNGRITASGLTGELELSTTNGSIKTSGTRGDLSLHTSNGGIRADDIGSADVEASTTNGSIELEFARPPAEVEARTTNGAIQVRVPTDGATYLINATTVNGNVNTGTVPSDNASERTITLETTNGAVKVESTNR
ncbi:DUF4097 family beta strand repeat-containing protein [Leifsonia sp. A12D58]|uniref:DUF4097 family beta strand repeat-containing protein n=1 Tax=Leifsonia sp. A12D58 TaxID=3397674 RepID=UPI0039E09958